jgi:hypothetical protein
MVVFNQLFLLILLSAFASTKNECITDEEKLEIRETAKSVFLALDPEGQIDFLNEMVSECLRLDEALKELQAKVGDVPKN